MTLGHCVGAACVVSAFMLTACGTGGYSTEGSQGAGKQLFLDAGCGSCHTLADAGTAGTIGPNLDDAFAQARESGMSSDTFTQVVRSQIKFPITETSTGAQGMPAIDETLPDCDDVEGTAFCVENQDQAAQDIAVYVGAVAGTGQPVETSLDGKTIFVANCNRCHTLAAAGTSGTIGPNLDQSSPSQDLVIERVTNGQGAMPSFENTLSPEQIQAVADYVAGAAGK